MKKFIKKIFQGIVALLINFVLIICLFFAGIFALLESIFKVGRLLFVSIITGIAEAVVDNKKTLPLVRDIK